MPTILQQGCTIQCPHGGTVTATSTNVHVKAGGSYVLLQNDVYTVSGCQFKVPIAPPPSTKPQPCITVEWQAPTNMVKVGGQSVLTETSVGLCKTAEQITQGKAIVSGPQQRVKGM